MNLVVFSPRSKFETLAVKQNALWEIKKLHSSTTTTQVALWMPRALEFKQIIADTGSLCIYGICLK